MQRKKSPISHLKELRIDNAPRLITLPDLPSVECLEPEFCRDKILTSATKITSLLSFIICEFEELVNLPRAAKKQNTSVVLRNQELLKAQIFFW